MIELRLQDGGAVVAKTRPGDPAARERLDRERALLVDAGVPGIVRPTAEDVTDAPALLLAPAGTSTLSAARVSEADVATIGRDLAATVLALHERGIGHGAIEADHVLWSHGRNPTLCGFGSAGPDVDPGADAEALCRLLSSIAPDGSDVMRAVARAGGDLRRLGAELAPSVPAGPTLPRTTADRRGVPSRRRPGAAEPNRAMRTATLVGAVVAGLLAIGGVVVALTTGGAEADTEAMPVAPATTAPAVTTTPVTTAPVATAPVVTVAPSPTDGAELVWPADTDCPDLPDPTGLIGGADLDLDGCDEPVLRIEDELHVGDRRFRLGSADDVVLVGEWSCSGRATPALVTRSDGAVHLFPDWPDEVALDVEAVAVVGPALDAVTAPVEGCDAVVVELADGTSREVTG